MTTLIDTQRDKELDAWIKPRLSPSNVEMYLHRKPILDSLMAAQDRLGGKLIDIGCGLKPYASIVDAEEHIGVEHNEAVNPAVRPDVIFDGLNLPFEDEEFDSALCTEVLEHVEHPSKLIREIHRVLKPGGSIFLTVPMTIHHHEVPHDYRRLTCYGMQKLLEQNGFEVIRIDHRGKILSVFSALTSSMLTYFVSRQPVRFVLQVTFYPLVCLLVFLERYLKREPASISLGWQALAVKISELK